MLRRDEVFTGSRRDKLEVQYKIMEGFLKERLKTTTKSVFYLKTRSPRVASNFMILMTDGAMQKAFMHFSFFNLSSQIQRICSLLSVHQPRELAACPGSESTCVHTSRTSLQAS